MGAQSAETIFHIHKSRLTKSLNEVKELLTTLYAPAAQKRLASMTPADLARAVDGESAMNEAEKAEVKALLKGMDLQNVKVAKKYGTTGNSIDVTFKSTKTHGELNGTAAFLKFFYSKVFSV